MISVLKFTVILRPFGMDRVQAHADFRATTLRFRGLSERHTCASIPKGVKKKSNGLSDYTQYKAIIDLDNQCYYFMKYGDAAFMKAFLDSNSDEVKEFQH